MILVYSSPLLISLGRYGDIPMDYLEGGRWMKLWISYGVGGFKKSLMVVWRRGKDYWLMISCKIDLKENESLAM